MDILFAFIGISVPIIALIICYIYYRHKVICDECGSDMVLVKKVECKDSILYGYACPKCGKQIAVLKKKR